MENTGSPHIRSLLRGSEIVGPSSVELGWNGFCVERHEIAAGEKPAVALQQYFVAVWSGAPSYGERPNLRGQSVVFAKRPGSISLLPAGQAPPLRLSSSTEITVVAFEPAFIARAEASLERKVNAPFLEKLVIEDPELSTLVSLLMKECEAGGVHGRIYAESLAYAIAMRFVYLVREERHERSPYRPISSPQSIHRVLERLHIEFALDLNLSTMAAQSGYSLRHFLRIFEEATGRTPHRYLLHLRLKHATELIRKRSMPLVDIAVACGFSSQSHMSRVFRKLCGATPGEIRRMATAGHLSSTSLRDHASTAAEPCKSRNFLHSPGQR
jgi:AraC family transcriptional regulator